MLTNRRAFGRWSIAAGQALADASYLAGTVRCGFSGLLTWRLFGSSTRVQHPPIPEQALAVSGFVEPFVKVYGRSYGTGRQVVLYFVRVGELTFAVGEGTGEAFEPGLA